MTDAPGSSAMPISHKRAAHEVSRPMKPLTSCAALLRMAAILPLLVIFAGGCDNGPRVVPVKGVVMRGGQPFKASLIVTFYPESGGRPSTGVTDAEGRFELKFDKDTKGAAVGTHKVVVAFRPRNPTEEGGNAAFHPDQDAILEKFGKKESTALSVEISHAESDLQLKLD